MSQKQDRTSNNTNQTNENTQAGNTPHPTDQRRFIDKHFGKMMGAVIVLTLLVNVAIWFTPRGFFSGMMPGSMPNRMMNPNQMPPVSNDVPATSPPATSSPATSPPATSSPASQATGQPASELLALGEQRFAQVCANCHGVNGQGYVAAGAPPLNGSAHAWHHSDVQIRGWLRNGYNTMPAVPSNWTDRDIDAVLAYVKQWWTPDQQAFQAGLE